MEERERESFLSFLTVLRDRGRRRKRKSKIKERRRNKKRAERVKRK